MLIGGEAEVGRIDRLAAGLQTARVIKADGWPLVQLAGALASVNLFAGVDSGVGPGILCAQDGLTPSAASQATPIICPNW